MARAAIRFPASPAEARAGILATIDMLKTAGLPGERLDQVQIVLAEVVNNIVEHGYAPEVTGHIGVNYALSPSALTLVVIDTGAGFPGGGLPPDKATDLSVPRQDLPEGGFGWPLIRKLTSAITYDRREGCNLLGLQFDL